MERGARFAFSRSVPMQRGARFAFCGMLLMQRGARFEFGRSAPMQRGAHFSILDIPLRALCWAQARRPKRYKINAFSHILKMKSAPGAATRWNPKSKTCKIYKENQCFSPMPWRLFGVHFGWPFFCLPILGPQDGPP